MGKIAGIAWWIGWIALSILSFFAACAFWTHLIATRFGPLEGTRLSALWVAAVFGTWLLFLVPLIIVMYRKVDKAYEDAQMKREEEAYRDWIRSSEFRSTNIQPVDRELPPRLKQKLLKVPEIIKNGQLVTLILKDGRRAGYVFVRDRGTILGVYDDDMTFRSEDIADLEPCDLDHLPHFEARKWLRVDGMMPSGERVV